jgi:hypothetical protein
VENTGLADIQKGLYVEYCMNGYRDMWEAADRACGRIGLGRIGTLAEIGLITSEAAEAMEHVREPTLNPEMGEELVDILIRTLNCMTRLGFNAESIMLAKNQKNLMRGKLHGRQI